MKSGFGVVGDVNLRFLMCDLSSDEYEELLGKYVSEEIGGVVCWDWEERQ